MSERSQELPTVSLELPHMKWIVLAMAAGTPLVAVLAASVIWWVTGVFHLLIVTTLTCFGDTMACGFAIALIMCRKRFDTEMQDHLDQIKAEVEHRISATQDQLRAGFDAQLSAAHERGVRSGRQEALEGLEGQEFDIPVRCPHGATFVVVLRFGALILLDDDPGADSPADTVVN